MHKCAARNVGKTNPCENQLLGQGSSNDHTTTFTTHQSRDKCDKTRINTAVVDLTPTLSHNELNVSARSTCTLNT